MFSKQGLSWRSAVDRRLTSVKDAWIHHQAARVPGSALFMQSSIFVEYTCTVLHRIQSPCSPRRLGASTTPSASTAASFETMAPGAGNKELNVYSGQQSHTADHTMALIAHKQGTSLIAEGDPFSVQSNSYNQLNSHKTVMQHDHSPNASYRARNPLARIQCKRRKIQDVRRNPSQGQRVQLFINNRRLERPALAK